VTTIQWSRRFIGLKLFMTLAELGGAGVVARIEHQVAMADLLRRELSARGWRIANDSPLAIVCFSHPAIESGATTAADIARAVVGGGRAWISEARLGADRAVLRACITSFRTQPEDVTILVEELERVIAERSATERRDPPVAGAGGRGGRPEPEGAP
jgi:glutamate/tyrosine decarboxylase-like PLP-dependent enzyme